MLGHANVSTKLDNYSHVIEGKDGGLGDAMDEALGHTLLHSPPRNGS